MSRKISYFFLKNYLFARGLITLNNYKKVNNGVLDSADKGDFMCDTYEGVDETTHCFFKGFENHKNKEFSDKELVEQLHIAIRDCSKNVCDVKRILEETDVDVNGYYHNMTALYAAVGEENVEVVKLLLEREDIDVNKGGDRGQTPLWVACYRGNIEIVRMLLNHEKIKVNIATNDYYPIELAVSRCHKDVFILLLLDERVQLPFRGKFFDIISTPDREDIRGVYEEFNKSKDDFVKKYEYMRSVGGKILHC